MQASHIPEADPRRTHEYVPLATPSKICWHDKDFAMPPEADANAGEIELGSYNSLRCTYKCPNVLMMFYDVLMITSELCDIVRPA